MITFSSKYLLENIRNKITFILLIRDMKSLYSKEIYTGYSIIKMKQGTHITFLYSDEYLTNISIKFIDIPFIKRVIILNNRIIINIYNLEETDIQHVINYIEKRLSSLRPIETVHYDISKFDDERMNILLYFHNYRKVHYYKELHNDIKDNNVLLLQLGHYYITHHQKHITSDKELKLVDILMNKTAINKFINNIDYYSNKSSFRILIDYIIKKTERKL